MKHEKAILCAVAAAVVLSAVPAIAQLAPADLKIAEANFKKANVSGSGKLTADEFKTFIDLNADAKIGKAAKIKSFGAYSKAFAAVDADKDGTITWEEYTQAQRN
jgi:Ca2+-binding EF-hand superfamily protein